jgi:hypothetical protein
LAYQSNASGDYEIFVDRYPELGSRQRISTAGGARPRWSADGSELFFVSVDGQQMFAAAIQSGRTLVAGRPRVLFASEMLQPVRRNRPYDVAPDERFVIIRSGEANARIGTPGMIVVQNWFEELKRLVPTK